MRRALLMALLILGLTGCAHKLTVGASRTFSLGVTEYRLTPDNVSVQGAGVVTIVVHNYGRLTHNLVVSEDGQAIAGTSTLWPGQTAQLALRLAPGKYQIASTFLTDPALGAYGTLTVSS